MSAPIKSVDLGNIQEIWKIVDVNKVLSRRANDGRKSNKHDHLINDSSSC